LIGFATCFLFLPLGSPCLPVVGDRFGGEIGYLFRNFVIIHIDISLSDSSILFQKPRSKIIGRQKRSFKNELVHHRRYKTREQALREITEYIEVFYNRQRRQARLGYLSPAVYERQFYARQVAA
jgi:transposase InsO family protein